MNPRSCVGKDGQFIVGIHEPDFKVKNLRPNEYIESLGSLDDGTMVDNQINFPATDLEEPGADIIYEIANAFAFKGTTYINSAWADAKAAAPETIRIPEAPPCSLTRNIQAGSKEGQVGIKEAEALIDLLPQPLLIALAQASTDPDELVLLAKKSCSILFDPDNSRPVGIGYKKQGGKIIPDLLNHELFEVIVNNPCLPNAYKNVMVLKPGVQGHNEITAEYLAPVIHKEMPPDIQTAEPTHVFEYLRRNSYIPWGHFASNMANDAIRYSTKELSAQDMTGIRHLYYQRAYIRMAQALDIRIPEKRACLSLDQLESLRKQLLEKLPEAENRSLEFNATLWGWNFGFGYAQSGHRLHASHQMIHQQNAMIPASIPTTAGGRTDAFACGDQIGACVHAYKAQTGIDFFNAYKKAIFANTRTDGKPSGPSSLILAQDDHTLLFVPKAQVCEFELQLIPRHPCGNIFEAGSDLRQALDKAILLAVKTLESLGAKMVTSIEYSKRFDSPENGQHLIYSFIPRLPYAPGTFSEAQNRWISGLYPEDFAQACRMTIQDP